MVKYSEHYDYTWLVVKTKPKSYFLFLILSVSNQAFPACLFERLEAANTVDITSPVIPQDISQTETSSTLLIPITLGIGGEALYPSITTADMNITISHPAIVWSYSAYGLGLTERNLNISYQITSGGTLVSKTNAGSRIRVIPTNREITRWRFFRRTIFDAYVDFSFDLSDTTHAGVYEGTMIVNVECNR